MKNISRRKQTMRTLTLALARHPRGILLKLARAGSGGEASHPREKGGRGKCLRSFVLIKNSRPRERQRELPIREEPPLAQRYARNRNGGARGASRRVPRDGDRRHRADVARPIAERKERSGVAANFALGSRATDVERINIKTAHRRSASPRPLPPLSPIHSSLPPSALRAALPLAQRDIIVMRIIKRSAGGGGVLKTIA